MLPVTNNSDQESDLPDRAAVARALAGDQKAYSELYARNSWVVRRIGLRFVHRSEELDDFVQEVFLKAFSSLGSYRGTGTFRSWLGRIAATTGINARERERVDEPAAPEFLDETLPAQTDTRPDLLCMAREAATALKTAIAALPAEYARLIEQVYFQRLRYREISEMNEVPVGTLKARVHRAKARMEQVLLRLGIQSGSAALATG